MKQDACFVIGSDTHWFRLNGEGALIHVIHRFEDVPNYTKLKAHEAISSFFMIPKDGMFHILAKTPSGIYYMKHQNKELQEIRVAPHAKSDHPYLFFDLSTLYVCYILYEEESCRLVVKARKDRAWQENAITLFEDDVSRRIGIEDIVFAAAGSGRLYSLFRYRNERHDHILALLQNDLGSGERNVYRMFVAKDDGQSWRIAIGIDPSGNPHISWTIKKGETVTYYYSNIHHAEKSRMPLFLSDEQEPQRLYFIHDWIVLLFTCNERLQWICSADGGETWSKASDMGFQANSGLRFVQGVKEGQDLIAPVLVLGVGSNYFRSFEWMDLLHGCSFKKPSVPYDATLQLQFEQLSRNLMYQMESLRRDLNELSTRNDEQERMIQRLQEKFGIQIEEDRNHSAHVSYNRNMHLPSSREVDINGNTD